MSSVLAQKHDNKPSPDTVVSAVPPTCAGCGTDMWLVKVIKTISDDGISGIYKYECRTCGSYETVREFDPRPQGCKIAPDVR
jgi:hypothetical protein